MSDRPPLAEEVPAATVVLLRDRDARLEVLMVRRGADGAFGGMWAFPGGQVDPEDHDEHGGAHDAARRAAVRETLEEVGLTLDESALVPLAHWVPEVPGRRRFATWFFVGAAPSGEVVVDGVEIGEALWIRPGDVLDRRDQGDLRLMPPTWLTLHDLAGFERVEAALEHARGREPFFYVSRVVEGAGRTASLWPGDAGYDAWDLDAVGPRHRLWIDSGGWRLERDVGT